ncbi:hypothetical protein [Mariniblastus fucicola]|uniref:PEP-CTERM protein-sorting domain-containing protein n=1 Tax=Mariniblastus fucicola TaxID=980251 RepID=A0A5B9P9X1_9BACT|nr:hypothetical protein [Mariniblastus fucicola]QEG23138.1 hypothetical protein MFFC18_30330 [Mariniblastus fucicola]
MKTNILRIAVCLIAAMVWNSHPVSADTVYNIAPYSMSNGYEIVGGSITTDDTVGQGQTDFFNSNIVDYEVIVTGPINLTFTPSNRSASIFSVDSGLMVTDTGIWLEPSDSSSHQLRIEAREIGINALNIQQVFWSHGPSGNPASTVGFVAGGGTDQGTFNQSPRVDRLLIAGSLPAVPEPTSGAFLIALFIACGIKRHRG